MPYKKYGKRKSKKYSRRRRNNYTNSTLAVVSAKNNTPLPTVFKTNLRYVDQVRLDATVPNVQTHYYSCNSLYDPDRSATGHQPLGFDQIMPLYDHYRVLGSKITVRASNNSGNAQTLFITISDSWGGIFTTMETILENGKNKSVWLAPLGSGGNTKQLSYGVNPHKWLTVDKKDKALTGTISTDPDEECFFAVGIGSSNIGVEAGSVDLQVIIEYASEFIEPRALAGS